jgi:hypothetical protein
MGGGRSSSVDAGRHSKVTDSASRSVHDVRDLTSRHRESGGGDDRLAGAHDRWSLASSRNVYTKPLSSSEFRSAAMST